MKYLVLLIMFTLSSLTSFASETKEESKSQTKDTLVVIDVRTLAEYNAGHVENALNIPLQVISRKIDDLELEKDTPIALYCRSGNRSGIANSMLKSKGYENSQNYGGLRQAKDKLDRKVVK